MTKEGNLHSTMHSLSVIAETSQLQDLFQQPHEEVHDD